MMRLQQPWPWMDQHDASRDVHNGFAPPTTGQASLTSGAQHPKPGHSSAGGIGASHPHEINELAHFLGADDFGIGFDGLDPDTMFNSGLLL